MAATTANVSELLKRVYEGRIEDQLNSRDSFYGMLRKKDGYAGEQVEIALRTGRSSSGGWQGETDTLKVGDRQRYTRPVITAKEYYRTLKLSLRLMSHAKTNKGAFLEALNSEVEGMALDIMNDFERASLGDGSGTLMTISSVSETNGTLTPVDIVDARKFFIGQVVEAWSARTAGATKQDFTTTAGDDSGTVSAINFDTGVVTLTSGDTNAGGDLSANDVIVTEGARLASTRYEMMGIQGIVSDADSPMEDGGNSGSGLQNVLAPLQHDGTTANSAGNSSWQSKVFSNSGTDRAIDERLLQQAIDAPQIRGNGKIDCFVTNFAPRLEYALGQLNVRRNVNTMKLAGQTGGGFQENIDGKDYIEYGQRKIIPDRFCEANAIYALDSTALWVAMWARLQWLDRDGAILKWSPDRTPAYEAIKFCHAELVTNSRNSHSKIEDVEGTEV